MAAEPAKTPGVDDTAAPVLSAGQDGAEPPRRDAAAYSFKDMRLKIGDPLQVEPPAKVSADRADSKLIGYLEGNSVVVTAPRTSRGILALREGEQVLVRTFTGKDAFAFRCAVIKAVRLPYEYLHLGFPAKVERVEVRSSPRFRLRQPASVTPAGGKPAMQGVIDNIGTSGALVEATAQIGDKGDHIRVDFKLTLHGVRASLSLKAVVRNVKAAAGGNAPPGWHHGVQFEDLEDKDRLILGSLIWYQMYEHPRTRV